MAWSRSTTAINHAQERHKMVLVCASLIGAPLGTLAAGRMSPSG